MKLRELELEIKTELEAGGFDDPGFETRQILAAILGVNTGALVLREQQDLAADVIAKARHWAAERVRGIPLAYITGTKGFYRHEFFVEPGVLVPRPESEHAVEVALRRAREQGLHVRQLADLGSGTGILGLSLLVEFPAAHLTAIDNSPIAARVSKRNAEKLSVADRFTMVEKAVEQVVLALKFDVIVANPPYIAEGDPNVQRSVHEHEPHAALYSDENGLGAIRRWCAWAAAHLRSGGLFVCEIGAGQSDRVREIMDRSGFTDVQVENDLAGHARIVSALRGE